MSNSICIRNYLGFAEDEERDGCPYDIVETLTRKHSSRRNITGHPCSWGVSPGWDQKKGK